MTLHANELTMAAATAANLLEADLLIGDSLNHPDGNNIGKSCCTADCHHSQRRQQTRQLTNNQRKYECPHGQVRMPNLNGDNPKDEHRN